MELTEGEREMQGLLELSERELMEIRHSLYYAEHLAHGTSGHLNLMLVAKLARYIGFALDESGALLPPGGVTPPKLQ